MIRLAAAQREVCQQAATLAAESVAIEDALGRILAEEITSDIDVPPFDKACMDGFAVRADDLQHSGLRFRVLEEITAGQIPQQVVQPSTASQIMTGSPIPAGADAIVVSEQSQRQGDDVIFSATTVRPGQNVQLRGSCLSAGQTVLQPGLALTAAAIGLLAEVGRARVQVVRRPRIGILATGDELVPVDQQPGPGQIRNSNSPLLTALSIAHGGLPVPLGVARDDVHDLSQRVAQGLETDLLLLSGGVSAGTRDLVPHVLSTLGVQPRFHKVALKPGKPVWFGTRQRTLVFGLPGNPVSSLVCFLLLVRPALEILQGGRWPTEARDEMDPGEAAAWRSGRLRIGAGEGPCVGRLAHAHRLRGDRETFLPARAEWTALPHTPPLVTLLPWQGSADLLTVAQANVLAGFPPGDREYQAGDEVRLVCL